MSSCRLQKDEFMHILSWLPVKDVTRCKKVSKEWNRLITNAAFVKLHLERSSRNTHILLTFDVETTDSYAVICPVKELFDHPSTTLDRLHDKNDELERDYWVLGVCNGLVCIQELRGCFGKKRELMEYGFHIHNPAIRVISKDNPPHVRLRYGANYKCPFMFGFGYEERDCTYQIVSLETHMNEYQKQHIRVYRLGDTTWRTVLTCEAISAVYPNGTCVSSTLCWLAYPRFFRGDPETSFKMKELRIFSYDLKNKTCRYLSMPDGEVEPKLYAFEALKGCLSFSYHHEGNFVVWIKREFNERSWSKLLNLDYQNGPHGLGYNSPYSFEIIGMSEDDDDVLLANTDTSEFLRYNIRNNTIEDRESYQDDKSCLFSYDYVESLELGSLN